MTVFKLTTLLTIITIQSFGQSADSASTDNWNWLKTQLKIINIEKSDAEVDLRIFLGTGITNAGQVIWISKDSTGWTGKKYDYFLKMKKGSLTNKIKRTNRIELKSSDWDSLWFKLQLFNIMTLPSQDEIKDKLRKEIKTARGVGYQVMIMTDGSGYDLEIKKDKKIVKYSFHEPCAYSNKYPDVDEVKSYCDIILTLEQEFQIKFRH